MHNWWESTDMWCISYFDKSQNCFLLKTCTSSLIGNIVKQLEAPISWSILFRLIFYLLVSYFTSFSKMWSISFRFSFISLNWWCIFLSIWLCSLDVLGWNHLSNEIQNLKLLQMQKHQCHQVLGVVIKFSFLSQRLLSC